MQVCFKNVPKGKKWNLLWNLMNNNNSMVQTVDFKAKTEEPDGNIGDNIEESLKDSETLDKT